jgi:signal transduction histidine kinase
MTQLGELQQALLRALAIGVVPTLLLSLGVGYLLGWRAVRRVRAVRRTVERIMSGNLRDRLAMTHADEDFDHLAESVNGMLDQIERLLEEVAGIGDDIAHDLRTPLTRVRTRLDRARQPGSTRETLIGAIDGATAGLDQALGIITALQRISEIEDGRRHAAFGDVDLSAVARDIAELYGPIAEAKGVCLAVDAARRLSVRGDRDLLIEAVANVLDNAIKFTPIGGRVVVTTFEGEGTYGVRIVDTGPGIPVEERRAVLKRFYRSDKSRHHFGSGLGLGLVQAIATLHGFELSIGDAEPGCLFEILCPPAR